MNDTIENAIGRLNDVESVTADKLAQVLFRTEKALALVKTTEEKLAGKPSAASSGQTAATPEVGSSSTQEGLQIRGGNISSRSLTERAHIPSAESPREFRENRGEIRIRSGPSPPPPSAPTGPMGSRFRAPQGGSDLHRRVTLPPRPPVDANFHHPRDTYRPIPKKRRRGDNSDSSDYT